MYIIRQPLSLFLLLLISAFSLIHTSRGIKIISEKRLLPFINRIYIHCVEDVGDIDLTTPVQFYRSNIIGGQVITELFASESTGVTGFNITSQTEGVFTCVDMSNNQVSTNNLSLVAFPYINSTKFTLPQENSVTIGHSSPPLYCGFTLGALPQYYQVEWWRGAYKLDTANASSRYRVLDNLTLLVEDTQISDASNGYYCLLKVINPTEGVVYNNTSPDISLQVYNPLVLSSSLTDTAIKMGQSTSFTCTAQGVPRPNIKWKISNNKNILQNPRYTTQEQVSTTPLLYTVTSTLTLSDAVLTDTGPIECVGYSNNGDDLNLEVNTANLVVFGIPSVPVLVPTQTGGVFLSVSLPSVIPVFFLVHIRYVSTADTNNNYETVLFSHLFTNTSTIINYNIPSHYLPIFSSFKAQVALEVYGTRGDYSSMSSITVLLKPATPSTTPTIITSTNLACPSTCTDNISLYIIIALLTTALIIVLIFLTVIAVYYYCSYKNKLKDNNLTTTLPLSFRTTNEDIKLPSGTNQYAISPIYTSTTGTCSRCKSDDHAKCTCGDYQTCTCTSPSECTCNNNSSKERKSVSSSPPVIYVNGDKTSDNTLERTNNQYMLDPTIEPLTSEPKVIKASVEEKIDIIKESPLNKEKEEKEEEEEEGKTPRSLLQPKSLYNDSLSSSQGNIPGLFMDTFPPLPPSPTPSPLHDPTSHVQTSVMPSFSQLTNSSPPPTSGASEEKKKEKGDGDVMTKSLNKILRSWEIV